MSCTGGSVSGFGPHDGLAKALPMGSSGVTGQTDRVAVAVAIHAAVLGVASAGVSAYWAFGGDGLLDTVGGDIERCGRERDTQVVVVLSFIVALKAIVAIAARSR
jgi:hypothetical protein